MRAPQTDAWNEREGRNNPEQRHEDRKVPTRERLDDDQRRDRCHPSPGWPREPPLERQWHERERPRPEQLDVSVSMVHPKEAERVYQPPDDRGDVVPCHPPRQGVHGQRVQRKGEQPHDPVGEHRIRCSRVEGQRKNTEADVMLRL
jgi:hypothetical protein